MKQVILIWALLSSSLLFARDFESTYENLGNIDFDSIACTLTMAMAYKPVITKLPGSDKLKHCTLSCMLAKSCNEEATFLMGVLKEIADAMGQGNPELNDIIANMKGIELSRELNTELMCYPTCSQHY